MYNVKDGMTLPKKHVLHIYCRAIYDTNINLCYLGNVINIKRCQKLQHLCVSGWANWL